MREDLLDVTEVLSAAASEAAVSIDLPDQLVAFVAHDLRNPLAAMLLGVRRLLRRDDLERAEAELLQRMTRSGERMARMLDQMLEYVRVRVGNGLPLARRECVLNEVCRRVIDELELVHATVRIELKAASLITGRFDEERIAEVFSNLIGNACEHGAGAVEVTLSRSRDGAVITVSNEGAPIALELLPHVFEPFRGRNKGQRSSGLGLFLTRALVLAHGGTIDVESSADAGTRFTVTLPLD